MKILTVVADIGGNVIATTLQTEPQAGLGHLRLRAANPEHRLHEIEVPSTFMQLPPDQFHESVKHHLARVLKSSGVSEKVIS